MLEEITNACDVLNRKKCILMHLFHRGLISDAVTTVKQPGMKRTTDPTLFEEETEFEEEVEITEVSDEFKIAEQYCFYLSSLFSYLLIIRPIYTCYSSLDVVHLLLKLITSGTPRIQRVSVRICSRVLGYHQPYMLGKWSSDPSKEKRYASTVLS